MERKLIGVLERDELDPTPPYPFASGPLFAVSRALGSLLTTDGFTQSWLDALEATPVLQFYKQRGRVPFVLRKDACFPASFDAVLGWWVHNVIQKNGHTLSLMNTPFMIQHHPWVAFRHGAFSNSSIILHELKNPNSPGWAHCSTARGRSCPFCVRVESARRRWDGRRCRIARRRAISAVA